MIAIMLRRAGFASDGQQSITRARSGSTAALSAAPHAETSAFPMILKGVQLLPGELNSFPLKHFASRSTCRCGSYRATRSSFTAKCFVGPVSRGDTFALLVPESHTGGRIGGTLMP